MAYIATRKYSHKGVRGEWHDCYSYRTSTPVGGALVTGESALGSVTDLASYLRAEQTAISELNSELNSSSLLGEGTWGVKDAGHVFSTVHCFNRRAVVYDGTGRSWAFWPICNYVDEFTRELWERINSSPAATALKAVPAPDPFSHENYVSQRITKWGVGPSRSAIIREASDILWAASPDDISGGLGQDLIDLVQIPKLIRHLAEMGSVAASLEKKWRRLSAEVRNDVDGLFRGSKTITKVGKKSASAYLEWNFVLAPYIEDFKLLVSVGLHLSGILVSVSKRSRVGSEHRTQVDTSEVNQYNPWNRSVMFPVDKTGNTSIFYAYLTRNLVSRYDIRVASRWRLRRPSSDAWSQGLITLNQKLGIIYPSLLWDLTPWTFLIDWFVNIGQSIDRLYYLRNGRYSLDYAYATIRGSSGEIIPGLLGVWPSSWYPNASLSVKVPITRWQTRFPITLENGVKPQWAELGSSQKKLLVALGMTHL